MKPVFLFAIAAGLVATTFTHDADAQQRRRQRPSGSQRSTLPGDSTYYYQGRRGGYSRGATINEATMGVLGKDTVQMNQKGRHRNLNQNSGQPLPPNNGRIGPL